MSFNLKEFIQDFKDSFEYTDKILGPSKEFILKGKSAGNGISAFPESTIVKWIVENNTKFSDAKINRKYPKSKKRIDLCYQDLPIEIKFIRQKGAINNNLSEQFVKHLLSPQSKHGSALTDGLKILENYENGVILIIIYEYDDPDTIEPDILFNDWKLLAKKRFSFDKIEKIDFKLPVSEFHKKGMICAIQISR
ncbi:MAG: hypothetical protein KAT48_15070 [Bacteroidales bacterium]|nr:hypothetical protein [Bacteroidales bacterium]